MTMLSFPSKGAPLKRGESPSIYAHTFDDNVEKADSDGGYQHRRRRFTRTPARSITTGFIDLDHEDYLVLENFYLAHLNDKPFIYFDYMMDTVRTVRFDDFKPDPSSVGTNRRWKVTIKISEV